MPPKKKNSGKETQAQQQTIVVAKKKELPPRPPAKPLPEPEDQESDPEAASVKDEEDESPVRAPRKKPTIQGHIEKYDQVLALLDAEIDRKSREKEKGARSFRKVRKILIQMRKELPVVARSKAARLQSSTRKNTTSGIMIQSQISEELLNFLKLPAGTRISRVDATRAICVYSHLKENEKRDELLRWEYLNPEGKRNLQNPQDKKAIIPDKALVKLLRYDQYKKDVKAGKVYKKLKDKETGKESMVQHTSDLLYYWVIQRLITIHFLKDAGDDAEAGDDE